jgi:Tc toxin complex TcA C-terminal TcB-binding domain
MHFVNDSSTVQSTAVLNADTHFKYTFENFFHPFVGALIETLNNESLAGFFNADYHKQWSGKTEQPPDSFFKVFKDIYDKISDYEPVQIEGYPKEIDVGTSGPYANYNWELLYHFPLAIAVHLSKNQRFADAQHWFHYIFDPTATDKQYWKFLRFRQFTDVTPIDELLLLLSTPDSELKDDANSTKEKKRQLRESLSASLTKIKNNPFQPHGVARLRVFPYQYSVVMKYLDNLIAWGDSLFQQDTIESINEATQIYVLAANILGERPQKIPLQGKIETKTFAQLKAKVLDEFSNALVELEGQFPFNYGLPEASNSGNSGTSFGVVPALYFCVPPNDKLLGYWDTVADRLFKIRHCMNIEGVVRQLALFDPPIDPGMLVKAAAAGIDIGSIVSGLNQPIGPVRSPFLIQKALELANEVRGLGNALLSAIEKQEGEKLALLRQAHEIKIQQLSQDVRFLQWKQAQESTEALLKNRASALERYGYYQLLLGFTPDKNAAPDKLALDRRELTEDNFDEAYGTLVGQYEKTVASPDYPQREAKEEGTLRLLAGEYDELNKQADFAEDYRIKASIVEGIAATLSAAIPTITITATPGQDVKIGGGEIFNNVGRSVGALNNVLALVQEKSGQYASKTASYGRRADDWLLQSRLAARELMQIGRQVLGSLIAEQIAHREYENIKQQIEQSEAVDQFLHEKYTSEELYAWMHGEISRLYYEYYRFAFDTARKAEKTMKRELMRPELDATDYVKFNYWDGGRKGLLSGEALYLDIKRMEMAYHENNKREFELAKHISLRQLNPLALLSLKATGTCEVTVPEWLFDLDCPGHYMRRVKTVNVSIPSVTGPYTTVGCTLSLLKSSVRTSPLLSNDGYARGGSEDTRFVDTYGTIQQVVTSSGSNDPGLFEVNLRDERFLPFEGAGAISTWKLELPSAFRQFDYNTISDVILHMRYTARQAGGLLGQGAVTAIEELIGEANTSGLALLLSLQHEFPSEWHKFVSANAGGPSPGVAFAAKVKRAHFPYFTLGKDIGIGAVQILTIKEEKLEPVTMNVPSDPLTDALKEEGEFLLSVSPDDLAKNQVPIFVLIKYSLPSS